MSDPLKLSPVSEVNTPTLSDSPTANTLTSDSHPRIMFAQREPGRMADLVRKLRALPAVSEPSEEANGAPTTTSDSSAMEAPTQGQTSCSHPLATDATSLTTLSSNGVYPSLSSPPETEVKDDIDENMSTVVPQCVSSPPTTPTPSVAPTHRWNKVRTTMAVNAFLTSNARSPKKRGHLNRDDSFLRKFTTQRRGNEEPIAAEDPTHQSQNPGGVPLSNPSATDPEPGSISGFGQEPKSRLPLSQVDPQSMRYMLWLGLVTVAVLYNLWTTIAREAFTEIREGHDVLWCVLDAICDVVYLADIGVQLRTSYLDHGMPVIKTRHLALHYIHSKYFLLDLVSLLPLDFLQIKLGFHAMLRFPRFLKVYRAWTWKTKVENQTVYPNAWRVMNFTHILFLLCHWFAGFYFLISSAYGFNDSWGYPKPVNESKHVTQKYLRSLYWSTLTLTTIGDLPRPEHNWQYVFTIASYLIGVFVFAIIVGQIGNAITNRNATRQEFEKILDNAKNYMRMHKVSPDLNKRVMRWYDYAWTRGRTSGGGDINALGLLPDKLKTELALHVNLETLKMVSIFQECRPEFLHDLVLKMRPLIFTPGDYICRKGEVAREMFIIADGRLEVISGTGEILSRMGSGDFFGEIGILNLDGGINRRTADVRSVGYSELFVLSKEDVLGALKDHPDAEELITSYGKKRLQEIRASRMRRAIGQTRKSSSAPAPPYNMLPGISKMACHPLNPRTQAAKSQPQSSIPSSSSSKRSTKGLNRLLSGIHWRRHRPLVSVARSCFKMHRLKSPDEKSNFPSTFGNLYNDYPSEGGHQSPSVIGMSTGPPSKPFLGTSLGFENQQQHWRSQTSDEFPSRHGEDVFQPLLEESHCSTDQEEASPSPMQRNLPHTPYHYTRCSNKDDYDNFPSEWKSRPRAMGPRDVVKEPGGGTASVQVPRQSSLPWCSTRPTRPLSEPHPRAMIAYSQSPVKPLNTTNHNAPSEPQDSDFTDLFQALQQTVRSKLRHMEDRVLLMERQLHERDSRIRALEKQLELGQSASNTTGGVFLCHVHTSLPNHSVNQQTIDNGSTKS